MEAAWEVGEVVTVWPEPVAGSWEPMSRGPVRPTVTGHRASATGTLAGDAGPLFRAAPPIEGPASRPVLLRLGTVRLPDQLPAMWPTWPGLRASEPLRAQVTEFESSDSLLLPESGASQRDSYKG